MVGNLKIHCKVLVTGQGDVIVRKFRNACGFVLHKNVKHNLVNT